MKIDRINEHILQVLKKDGKITNTVLAEKVGLSPSACLRRVQELENQGVISGYRAVINSQKLGKGFIAYAEIGISPHTKVAQTQFEEAITLAAEVVECHNVTGTFEYLLRIETNDMAGYKQFHSEVLGNIPSVSAISTLVVMDSPKDDRR
ncbi:Lrp/AsnC family transcriptional regulator [Reinekea marinisedimentorum]|uniref:Leucine-responsive regulatory protein n=1 Tax=Reinekea marinisedimentorum TaxID=230495 RepID=A0A4R3I4G4_9GAMM|nr:Lrp/AsnC family transcriptional regulator [Reinekea marinisedimentorum]TCS38859.1 DNA-binding Lrp family transcriptional regulator [Reinekea marinisedimentorum]